MFNGKQMVKVPRRHPVTEDMRGLVRDGIVKIAAKHNFTPPYRTLNEFNQVIILNVLVVA